MYEQNFPEIGEIDTQVERVRSLMTKAPIFKDYPQGDSRPVAIDSSGGPLHEVHRDLLTAVWGDGKYTTSVDRYGRSGSELWIVLVAEETQKLKEQDVMHSNTELIEQGETFRDRFEAEYMLQTGRLDELQTLHSKMLEQAKSIRTGLPDQYARAFREDGFNSPYTLLAGARVALTDSWRQDHVRDPWLAKSELDIAEKSMKQALGGDLSLMKRFFEEAGSCERLVMNAKQEILSSGCPLCGQSMVANGENNRVCSGHGDRFKSHTDAEKNKVVWQKRRDPRYGSIPVDTELARVVALRNHNGVESIQLLYSLQVLYEGNRLYGPGDVVLLAYSPDKAETSWDGLPFDSYEIINHHRVVDSMAESEKPVVANEATVPDTWKLKPLLSRETFINKKVAEQLGRVAEHQLLDLNTMVTRVRSSITRERQSSNPEDLAITNEYLVALVSMAEFESIDTEEIGLPVAELSQRTLGWLDLRMRQALGVHDKKLEDAIAPLRQRVSTQLENVAYLHKTKSTLNDYLGGDIETQKQLLGDVVTRIKNKETFSDLNKYIEQRLEEYTS